MDHAVRGLAQNLLNDNQTDKALEQYKAGQLAEAAEAKHWRGKAVLQGLGCFR